MKKLLNSKATECRSLLFIPGPVCCCRIQEWVLLPIFDIGHCSAAVLQCSGAGVTAPHLTPPSLSAKMEQPLDETLMRCTTERCSCCSVGCKYNHHLSMYKLSPHLLRTLWSQPVTPWCCSAAVSLASLHTPTNILLLHQTAAAASTHNTLWTGQCRL